MSGSQSVQSLVEKYDQNCLRQSLKSRIAKGEGRQYLTDYFEAYQTLNSGIVLSNGENAYNQQLYFKCDDIVGAKFISCARSLAKFLVEHGFPDEVVQSFKGMVSLIQFISLNKVFFKTSYLN